MVDIILVVKNTPPADAHKLSIVGFCLELAN